MGGVVDGQPVSAAITNPAFLDANGDDTANGKISLDNYTDPSVSGPSITNIQRELNALSSYTGKPTNVAYTTTPTWTNNDVGLSTDTLKQRADLLTARMSASTGHHHDGTPGNGAPIQAADIAATPLMGYWIQAVDITGLGANTNVSSQFTTETASNNSITAGVVVNTPYNKTILRQGSGVNTGDKIVDGSGNEVYGRLTNSGSTWTLSYYVDLSGTETVYSIPSAIDIRWYYQKLINPLGSGAPVYDPMAFIPSENVTADILDATASIAGKVLLANTAPPAIASASALGVSTRVALQDHTHAGVHNITIYGTADTVIGDTEIEAGTGVTLTKMSATRIKIDATTASVGYQETPAGTPNGVTTTFGPLTQTPANEDSLIVFMNGLVVDTADYSLSGSSIVFTTPPVFGSQLYAFYVVSSAAPPPPPSGVEQLEYRTISAGEATAKQLTLAATPASPTKVMVDTIGGCAQRLSVDFTIAGNVLNWSGYALDGILASGDVLRIHYWS